MDDIKPFRPHLLFAGLLYKDPAVLTQGVAELKQKFGEILLVSQIYPFIYTQFYEAELGPGHLRRFIFFKPIQSGFNLPDIKHQTNALEQKYAVDQKRRINIDPGYLNAAQVILATTKPFLHRIYLEQGIYGDLTLIYQEKKFQRLAWTYPDYSEPFIRDLFLTVRNQMLLRTNLDQTMDKGHI